MNIRILLITSQYFYPMVMAALERLDLNCQTTVVPYLDFSHIPQIYQEHQDRCDAVLLSGSSARRILELHFPNIGKPVSEFQVDSDALHRDILRFAVERGSLDFTRIALDFMLPIGSGYSVSDFLEIDDMPMVIQQNMNWLHHEQVLEQGPEKLILDQIRTLWEENAIDSVICMYSSNVPHLQQLGIPFRCPFLSDAHLKRLIKDILIKIELNQLHNNHPAVIQAFPLDYTELNQEQSKALEDTIRSFLHANLADCVIQQTDTCCSIITSMQIVRFLTDEFRCCQLQQLLSEKLPFRVVTAYGIGTTISHAMNNVQLASREAKLLEVPYAVDSNGRQLGPLNSRGNGIITHSFRLKLSEIARQSSLAVATIQKILMVMHNRGSDKITVSELAKALNTTTRNANRIMQNLIQGGFAAPIFTQSSHSRGRPVQVYALNLRISM